MTDTYRRFETCPKCKGPVAARQRHPFPILLQILFGLNFVALILLWESLRTLPSWIMWTWTALVAVLGFFLLRARKKASEKVLICIRCGTPIPS